MAALVMLIGILSPLNAVAEDASKGVLHITVTPPQGTYQVLNDVTGETVISTRSGNFSGSINAGDYLIQYEDIEGYTKPADESFQLLPGGEKTIQGNYEPDAVTEGILTVMVTPAEGKYEVLNNVTGESVVSERTGNFSGNLNFGDYMVDFKDISDEYITPADVEFTLGPDNLEETVNAHYELIQNADQGTLTITVTPAEGKYEVLNNVTGESVVSERTGNFSGNLNFGDYMVDFKDISDEYITPADVEFTLGPDNLEETVVGNYTTVPGAGTIIVNLVNQDNEVIHDGDWEINSCTDVNDVNSCTAFHADGVESRTMLNVPEGIYGISAELAPGYSSRAILSLNPQALEAGNTIIFNIMYTEESVIDDLAGIQVTTQPVAGGIRINGQSIGKPSNAGDYIPVTPYLVDITQENTISFDAEANYIKPADIVIPANILVAGSVTQYEGTYTQIVNYSAILQITTSGTLGEIFVDTVSQGVYDGANAKSVTVDIRADHTISFGPEIGFTTPADFVIPANFLAAGSVNPYDGVYVPISTDPVVTVTKIADQTTRLNGEYVTYTIDVSRTDSVNASVNVDVVDTISGATELPGNNGGKLALVVPNGSDCQVPQDPNLPVNNGVCGTDKITDAGGMNIRLPDPDSFVRITYRAQAVNAGIPQNQNSVVANTVDTTDSNGQTATASASVTVIGPQGGGVITGGGGGGGGGGYRIVKGDMELLVEKLVSLNGVDYRNAIGQDLAVVVPENQNTRLYTKVRITNDNEVSAKNITFDHFFDIGDSDMTAGEVEDLAGAELDNDGNILIEKIKAGEAVEFSYSVLIHENGQNSNPAFDGIEVVDYKSTLPRTQDGLKYVTKGEHFVTYIYAGQIPEIRIVRKDFGNASTVLDILVSADKSEARIGETVNYTLILTNVSDSDLTNLLIAHDYPAELIIESTVGGRDNGREIHFKRPLLRPGQSVTMRFTAKVVGGAVGSTVRSLTRAIVNEFENISPAESYLVISGGSAQVGPNYRLVQTGSGLLMSVLITLLAYLGYGAMQKRRYLKLKKEALKF